VTYWNKKLNWQFDWATYSGRRSSLDWSRPGAARTPQSADIWPTARLVFFEPPADEGSGFSP